MNHAPGIIHQAAVCLLYVCHHTTRESFGKCQINIHLVITKLSVHFSMLLHHITIAVNAYL